MPIISTIGRKSLKIRALIFSIYAVLTIGALTMVYPFALMISGSTKSAIDTPDPKLIPPFMVDDHALYQKHVEGLVNESLSLMLSSGLKTLPVVDGNNHLKGILTFDALQEALHEAVKTGGKE